MAKISETMAQMQNRLSSLEEQSAFGGFNPSSPSSSESSKRKKVLDSASSVSEDLVVEEGSAVDSSSSKDVTLSPLRSLWESGLESPASTPRRGILAKSKTRVTFASSEPQKLPMSEVPSDWSSISPGMTLGVEPGSLVFEDGVRFGPQNIDLDLDTYQRPVWRWKRNVGINKAVRGKLPVRQAYEEFVRALAQDPAALSEWSETSFKPPGSSSDRAVVVAVDDSSLAASFLSGVPKWFSDLARGEKPTWDEAVSPTNFLPRGLSAATPRFLADTFSRKKFASNEGRKVLLSDRVPMLPEAALAEEHGTRQHLLSCWNAFLAAEALARQETSGPGAYPMVKLLLQPLWTAFTLFGQKKLALRKLALKGSFRDSTLSHKLLSSNPLTPDLFDQEVVDMVISQADHQAKSVPFVLGFRSQPQKRSASVSGGRTPKKQKGKQQQQQPKQDYGQAGQRTPKKGRSPSPGKRGNTPKGAGRSPRSQRGKGPRTPKKGGKTQSF